MRSYTGTANRRRSARSTLHTASRASRAVTAVASGSVFNPGVPVSLRFLSKEDELFAPAAKTLFEYVFYCEGDVRKASIGTKLKSKHKKYDEDE